MIKRSLRFLLLKYPPIQIELHLSRQPRLCAEILPLPLPIRTSEGLLSYRHISISSNT